MSRSAVLLSGGLDSAVLMAMELDAGFDVWPIHVRAGLLWEEGEAAAIRRLLTSDVFRDRVRPLATLSVDMRDVYPRAHWAFTGQPPGYDSPDEAVYLAGRNVVLTAKTAIFSCQNQIARIALGPLAANPFPDATPSFFDAMSRALSLGLNSSVSIVAPLVTMHKADVIRRGAELGVPMQLTMSCLRPDESRHCGDCNKCRERREAFLRAGVVDTTVYGAAAEN
jgi:7-cyano-7-deazaguanine synthase